ncbi:MAG: hypothetical protein ACI9EF_001748 [Pseudohongiellaceae bacterium]
MVPREAGAGAIGKNTRRICNKDAIREEASRSTGRNQMFNRQYSRGIFMDFTMRSGGLLAGLLAVLALPAWALPTLGGHVADPLGRPLAGVRGVALGDDADESKLSAVASELSITHRGRKTDGHRINERITPVMRRALNTWAQMAQDLELSVAVPETAEALLIGSVDLKTLKQAAEVLDETWELLEPVMGEDTPKSGDAVLVLLFDGPGFRSEAWPLLLDELVKSGLLDGSARSHLRHDPGGLTIFSGKMFIQPGFDQAGDAAAGDDEFRLNNELAHKLTVSLLRSRFGQVPEPVRWGMGYVAEQRLFQSIFQFNRAGFVAVEEHFGWPDAARDELNSLKKRKKELNLAEMMTAGSSAGQRQPPQILTWAALDYLLNREPALLGKLLARFAELHDKGAKFRAVSAYAGASEATEAAVQKLMADLDAKSLEKHIKRVK